MAGRVILVVEAMTMEHTLTAPHDGEVSAPLVRVGDRVVLDQLPATPTPTVSARGTSGKAGPADA